MSHGFLDARIKTPEVWREQENRKARWDGRANRLQRALGILTLQAKPKWLLTLHFNHPYSMAWMISKLREFYGRLDHWALGRRFVTHPGRTRGVIIVENLDSNAHAHCAIRLPHGRHRIAPKEFGDWAQSEWKTLVPSGSMDFRRIDRTADLLASYLVKQIKHGTLTERLFWVEDFWPAKRAYEKYDKIKAKLDKAEKERLKAREKAKSKSGKK